MGNFLVIGGSSGIGKELCNILVQSGHQVIATYNEHEAQSSAGLQYHKLDVLSDELDLSFVPEELHGFAYCPGTIKLGPFQRFSAKDFIDDYTFEVAGAVKILHKIHPNLKASGQASAVFFSTVAVQTGFTYHSLVAASKGAIEGLTRSLAAEWAPEIRVNCIAPSLTDTPLAEGLLSSEAKKSANANRHPLKRIGSAEDIAQMAAFLLEDHSTWITGQVMQVDGGISALRA